MEYLFSAFLGEIAQKGVCVLLGFDAKKKTFFCIVIISIKLKVCAVVFAFPPPRPGIVDSKSGTYKTTGHILPDFPADVMHYRRLPRDIGESYDTPGDRAAGAIFRPLAIDTSTDGTLRPLILLIDFDDRQAGVSPSIANSSVFTDLYFGAGPADSSVKNYWEEVSYTRQGTNLPGRSFQVLGTSADIVGWLRAGTDFSTTVTSAAQISAIQVGNVRQLIADAVDELASQGFDFSPYVRPSDGTFQAVILHHPGYGQEDTGDVNDPYSHTARIADVVTPQGNIVDYTIVPSLQAPPDPTTLDPTVDPLINIGVIVHEMGHLFGLPDLYPVSAFGQVGSDFSGVGIFDLMGFGLWGDNFLLDPGTPAHLSAWSKMFLGWLNPVELSAPPFPATILSPVEAQPEAFKILINGPGDSTQYLLIENRQTDTNVPVPAWLFDNSLPGSGILIWHIDEDVIAANISTNTINGDRDFKGIDVEEADGEDELDQTIPLGGTPNDRAPFFGDQDDYFSANSQIFDRDNPNPGLNETNSSPIFSDDPVNNAGSNHPIDFGFNISISNFTIVPQNLNIGGTNFIVNFTQFQLVIGGSGIPPTIPDWRTFNRSSTQPPEFTNGPIVSDDVNVIGQDSSNAIWFGTEDRGISRLSGRVFESLNATSDDLPSDTVTAFTFDGNTGVMWVGTDNGVARMRDSGAGFALTPDTPFLTGAMVNDLAIDRDGFLWVATDSGLSVIDDGGTDSDSDDITVPSVIPGAFQTVVVSPGGNVTPFFDVIWAYDNTGRTLYRSSDPDDVLQFSSRSLPQNPIVNDISVDSRGLVWIATQNNGVLVYDDKLTVTFSDDELDPLDIDNNTVTGETVYITTPTTGDIASNRVTGITFQELQGNVEPIVYFSHMGILTPNEGGVTRIDLNGDPANRFVDGAGLTVFREDPAVPPEDETSGPASNTVRDAFADRSGNIWFSTDQGASRFGNAGILSLDQTAYLNFDAIATVTLEDDGLNFTATSPDIAVVFVQSGLDPIGEFLVLQETGSDTGLFTGIFGFTSGASGESADGLILIQVENDTSVTVTYNDASPPGERIATAVWNRVFPFDDDILIEGCFIATAAFGSYSSPMVNIFRKFRDEFLLNHYLGRQFVRFYYRVSPPGARYIREYRPARILARWVLVPLALVIHTGFALGGWDSACVLLVCAAFISLLRGAKRGTGGWRYFRV